MGQIIAFPALQGLRAGGLLVLAQAAIGDVVSLPRAAALSRVVHRHLGASSVAGPLLGGFITSALSWRWVFYVNLPVGLLALVMIAIGLRKPAVGQTRPIDYVGALLLTSATASLRLLLAWGGTEFPWVSCDSTALVGLTLALVGLFIWQERRAPKPLIRLPLFRNPVFARGVSVGGMMAFAMLGSTVFLPLYFQWVLGLGMGMARRNPTTAVQNAVTHRELGAATGAMSFAQSLGGALDVATSGTIMSTRLATAFAGTQGVLNLGA